MQLETATLTGQRMDGQRAGSGQKGNMASGEAGAKETREQSVQIHRLGV